MARKTSPPDAQTSLRKPTGSSSTAGKSIASANENLLDSWKQIAAYLRRDVRTVQRWERAEQLPVQRHRHHKLASVYAYKSELEAWLGSRKPASQKAARTISSSDQKTRLAILPFESLVSEATDYYFTDGLTEEMITQITRLGAARLVVIARATAMEYKNKPQTVAEIQRHLALDYVLQGMVRRGPDRIRITAQLVDVRDQTQIWAETYEREMRDILALQAEIAQAISREIHQALRRSEAAPNSAAPHAPDRAPSGVEPSPRSVQPAAYDAYLKGRYLLHGMTGAGIAQSLTYFETAIREEPEYAPAYAGIATAWALLAIAPFDLMPPHQAMPRAEAAAQRSLQLDDSQPEAHAALALVRHHYRWDWPGAQAAYLRAIELNSAYAAAHLWYSWLLLALGRQAQAFAEIDRTLTIVRETDPHRLVAVLATRAAAFYFARDFAGAVRECGKALQFDSQYFMLHYILGRSYARLGKHRQAVRELGLQGVALGAIPLLDAALGLAMAVGGRKKETRKMIASLRKISASRYVPATYFGMLYAGVGDTDEALQWLEKALEERAAGLTWLNVEPMLDELRELPRFQNLLRRLAL